jgi:phosphopantetheine adenylyltransferase
MDNDDFDNLITKKQSSPQITSVAAYDSSTPYVIVVGEEEFTLNLKQDQFTEEEKTKINAIKTYLENLDNFNLTLPKRNYSDGPDNLDSTIDSLILDAIKLKLENNIDEFTIGDYALITKKVDSTIVTEVAAHDAELPTEYVIVVGKDEFTLKLKQEEFTELEKRKIENIQNYLRNINNVDF